jgi:hypothetical protein
MGAKEIFLTRIIANYLKNKDYSARRDELTHYTRVENKGKSWFNITNSVLYAHSQIFTCFVWFSEKIPIIFPNNAYLLVYVMETKFIREYIYTAWITVTFLKCYYYNTYYSYYYNTYYKLSTMSYFCSCQICLLQVKVFFI